MGCIANYCFITLKASLMLYLSIDTFSKAWRPLCALQNEFTFKKKMFFCAFFSKWKINEFDGYLLVVALSLSRLRYMIYIHF